MQSVTKLLWRMALTRLLRRRNICWIIEIQKKFHMQVDENLPLTSLILTLCGLSLVVDAIHQNEINKVYNLP